ncbi:glycerophosphodiester phosphodiesterase [Erythrobacter sp. SG61-1L]|uniref:glycerophosphodiester phosphodiesterase n=1 Tax=Erythrobacter sp. SG61-1L TaxID=1603897 RepID=UPI0006D6D065|nr:glycerophosphodiester phosphodiesterase [Erythrobacter sp. SG61-1L]KPL68848.1 glycerophosphodiester phosphodiesterase [Erythrobacter sp. SG61-1L]
MAEAPLTIIAHRGASGERPEHTLASYERAIDQGADFIEPDLVSTKDGVLVARHENEISGTTDVADHPEFADRKAIKTIDGEQVTGWFTEDFTLAELRTLRAKERLPDLRVANTRFDRLFQVPTLAEVLALVKAKEAETGRRIGIYPELKHPTFFKAQGFALGDMLLRQLGEAGYGAKDDPVFIQCFEVGPLEELRPKTKLRLVQLMAAEGAPADRSDMPYARMVTPEGLKRVAAYADGVGADLRLILNSDGSATPLVADAHAAGLLVHGWTLRRENAFLPAMLHNGTDLGAHGNMAGLVRMLEAAGVDGLFSDNPADAIAAR